MLVDRLYPVAHPTRCHGVLVGCRKPRMTRLMTIPELYLFHPEFLLPR